MGSLSKFGVPVGGQTSTVLMPKLSYRFRVTFNNMGGAANANALTHQVQSVTRPTLSHEPVTLDVYNSRVYLAGKHTWEPITLVIRDDVDGSVVDLVDKQLQNQIDHNLQSAPLAGAQYKFSTIIETLDGTNVADTPGKLDKWTLAGCFFTNVAYGESDYSNSAPMTISLTVQYDNAQHEGTTADPLLEGNTITDELATGATS